MKYFNVIYIGIILFCILHLNCENNEWKIINANETNDTTVTFISRGLQGLMILSIRESKDYIYACAGKDGLYRVKKTNLDERAWQYLGLRTRDPNTDGVYDVAVIGDNDDVICAGIGNNDSSHAGLMRSTNQGTTWERSDSNLVGNWSSLPDFAYIHSANYFAVSPIVPGLIFTVNWYNSVVYRSSDSGKHWEGTHNPATRFQFMSVVEIEPRQPEHIWAAGVWGEGRTELQQSTDHGKEWKFVSLTPFLFMEQNIFTISFGDVGEIYLKVRDQVLRSTNDGLLWEVFFDKDSTMTLGDVAVDPNDVHHIIILGNISPNTSRKTKIYEYAGNALERIHQSDSFAVYRMRVIEKNRLFFGTLRDGVYEAINILKNKHVK
jgi:hypothetical protein